MKAIDPCPRWMWRDPEEIIERLIAISERVPTVRTVAHQVSQCAKDRYYVQARRVHVKQLMRAVMRGAR